MFIVHAGKFSCTVYGRATIAEHAGYTSDVAFRKAFKRHVGVGPGAFRRGDRQ